MSWNEEEFHERALEMFRPFLAPPLSRNQLIWLLVNALKIPQKKIVEITGLNKSSVSRIAGKKQGWTVKRRYPRKRR